MSSTFNRRQFLHLAAMGGASLVLSNGLTGCGGASSLAVNFKHGVASGDPSTNSVILWTRVTPEIEGDISVSWEIATDKNFQSVIQNGSTSTDARRDYTIKIDAQNLEENHVYYYRFISGNTRSPLGRTQTLPLHHVDSVTLALLSCANYPAGHFYVYKEAAARQDINAVVHLGDYIYEYADNGYASEQAAAMNRVVQPAHELISLDDYRSRYAQYRTDTDLQTLHAHVPFICVWDDHEICNDSWREGAQNHNQGEGEFAQRKLAALQAYYEWLPIRPVSELPFNEAIYRSFEFADLLSLHMLDTRLLGRDRPLDYANYIDTSTGTFDIDRFNQDLSDPHRTLLGAQQLTWLQGQLATSPAKWQLLGQQVLMAKVLLPAAIVTQQMSIADYAELAALALLAGRAQVSDTTLTEAEKAHLQANQPRLTPQVMTLLSLPAIPYNLDAWDGYAHEREVLYQSARESDSKLVVLAGDTHNAWASDLKDAHGNHVGVEFATPSVSSPGLESYLDVAAQDIAATEAALVGLIENLSYLNMSDRGFMTITCTHDQVTALWHYVSDVKQSSYTLLSEREHSLQVSSDNMRLQAS